jgi:hypothetical protein
MHMLSLPHWPTNCIFPNRINSFPHKDDGYDVG